MPSLLILPGDGIGPEVMVEVRRIIEWFRISNNRKCPICSSACWDDIYISLLIFTNRLIPMDLLKN